MVSSQFDKTGSSPPALESTNGWGEWANYVLAELKRLNETCGEMHKEIAQVNIEVVTLKVKSGLWGAISGAVTVALLLGVSHVRGELMKNNAPAYQPPPYTYSVPRAFNSELQPTVPPGFMLVPIPEEGTGLEGN